MASRGSALSRALAFFRDEPDLDIVAIAAERVQQIVLERAEREAGVRAQDTTPKPKRTRRRRTQAGLEAPTPPMLEQTAS